MKKILIVGVVSMLFVASVVWVIFSFKRDLPEQSQRLYEQSLKLIEAGRIEEARFNLEKIVADFGDSEMTSKALLNLARLEMQDGNLLEAKKLLDRAVTLCATIDDVGEVQKAIGDVNVKILFSPTITEGSSTYEVEEGDTLYAIARKFNTTVELLQKSNNLRDSTIRPGDRLKVVTAKFSVLVDKSENTLTLKEGAEVLKIYSVATGEHNTTPVGTFSIVNKLVDPVWYKAGAIVAAESPDNILGKRWMGLSVKGYGIHGTTQPETIGKQVTEGCVRMHNTEAEELYSILPVGTEVVIED